MNVALTRDQIKPSWIDVRREIILRKRYAIRAGAKQTIELRLERGWSAITLPDGGTQFETDEDRDAILKALRDDPLHRSG